MFSKLGVIHKRMRSFFCTRRTFKNACSNLCEKFKSSDCKSLSKESFVGTECTRAAEDMPAGFFHKTGRGVALE